MGNPAARVGDLHTCPMVDPGPKPHVGGPINPPGATKVIIGGAPAARVGDMCTCVGPPDTIAMGAPLVPIEGKACARMTDTTAHGGMIAVGCPTVLVGVNPRGKSPCSFQLAATKKPTDAQKQEIQDALDSGDNQKAIDLTKEYYGIDTSNVPNGVVYDPAQNNYGVTSFDGNIRLGDPSMASPDVLASTIVHEGTHANQAAILRTNNPTMTGWPSGADAVNTDEALAYESELQNARQTGLSDHELELAAERYGEHYRELPPELQEALDKCSYG